MTIVIRKRPVKPVGLAAWLPIVPPSALGPDDYMFRAGEPKESPVLADGFP